MSHNLIVYYVDKITNNINDKTYIGKRKCPKSKTPWTDVGYMGGGSCIKASEKKYGIHNFSKEILAVTYNSKTVCILEIEYISLYKSIGKDEYIIAPGGEGGHGPTSEATKRKVSELLKNRTLSQEHCKHISEAKLGKPAKNKGTRWYNDGEHNIMAMSCPKGYQKGVINKRCLSKEEKQSRLEKIKRNEAIADNELMRVQEKKKQLYNSKSCHWYNNGIQSIRAKECPEGFVPGRLGDFSQSKEANQKRSDWYNNLTDEQRKEYKQRISNSHKGKHFTVERKKHIGDGNRGRKYYNNGIIEVMQFECPEGFVPGRCPKSKQAISKGTKKQTKSNINNKE